MIDKPLLQIPRCADVIAAVDCGSNPRKQRR